MHWWWLAVAVVFEVIGTVALREVDGLSKPLPLALVVLGYGMAFYCLTHILKVIPVGITYAIWSGAGSALVVLVSWFWLKQKLDAGAIAGIGMIVGGVVVMRLFSKTMVL
jgi:small multidrug resistance pump